MAWGVQDGVSCRKGGTVSILRLGQGRAGVAALPCRHVGGSEQSAWGEATKYRVSGNSEGKKKEKEPPHTRVWGEGESGRRGRASAARRDEENPHALAFGVRVRAVDGEGRWRREKARETKRNTPHAHI
jgi:hypothetical protein